MYDEFYDEVIECDDGSLYVEAELPNNDILYTKLLSFGDDVGLFFYNFNIDK